MLVLNDYEVDLIKIREGFNKFGRGFLEVNLEYPNKESSSFENKN